MKKYEEILDLVKSAELWREECPARLQLFHYIMNCFVNNEKIVGKPFLSFSLNAFKDEVVSELTSRKEKYEMFEEIFYKSKKDADYFDNFMKPFWEIKKELQKVNDKITNSDLKALSDQELAELYKELNKVLYDFVIYGTFFEIVDPYTENLPNKIKKKYNLEGKDVTGMIVTLSTPNKRSFLTQEKIDFAKVCLEKMTPEEFHDKYFWIDSNYKEAPELTVGEIKKRVELNKRTKEELKKEITKTEDDEKELIKKKEEFIKELNLDEEDKLLFSLVSEFGRLIDNRKYGMMTGNYSKFHIIAEIARRKDIALEDFMFFTEDEAIKFLLGEEINVDEILERKKNCFIYYAPGEEQIFTGEKANELYNAYMENIMSEEFKGNVTYNPRCKIKGKVCKVIDTKKDKFEEETILVTTMTRPDFMPMMRKAKAVITDEGGLTCHAAIVSREMKIPCIVGTKVATKMLETGDEIEMNFCLGKIYKIK